MIRVDGGRNFLIMGKCLSELKGFNLTTGSAEKSISRTSHVRGKREKEANAGRSPQILSAKRWRKWHLSRYKEVIVWPPYLRLAARYKSCHLQPSLVKARKMISLPNSWYKYIYMIILLNIVQRFFISLRMVWV